MDSLLTLAVARELPLFLAGQGCLGIWQKSICCQTGFAACYLF